MVNEARILNDGDEALFGHAHLHMRVALIDVEVEVFLAGIAAADGPAELLAEHGGDLLRHAQAPVAVFAAVEHALLDDVLVGLAVQSDDVSTLADRALDVEDLSGAIDAGLPPGDGGLRIRDQRDHVVQIDVVFDCQIRLLPPGLQIALDLVRPADVALLARVVRIVGVHDDVAVLVGEGHIGVLLVPLVSADRRQRGIIALADVDDMGQLLPFELQGGERLFADGFAHGDDDHADLGALMMRLVAQIAGLRGEARHEVDVRKAGVVPADDAHDAGDLLRLRVVDADETRVRVGAAEELGVQHAGQGIVRAVLGDARRHGVGGQAGDVGLSDDAEIVSLAVRADQIRHWASLPSDIAATASRIACAWRG